MIDGQKVGQRIKNYREDAQLTQDNLAQKLNVSRQSVSKWEKGGSLPDIDRLVAMTELFNISLDKLILGQDKNVQKVVLEKSASAHLNFWDFLAKYWWLIIILFPLLITTLSDAISEIIEAFS
ncbi:MULTISPECIES: helix-turn-helix domain-containing protein [Lactobacillus]|uniref:XRE family transcriptional regulator n=1 Tax=Lactobacillus xujianguonis TaxID=2495899 RepID=A0A437SX87_9LACO|nr:MULTISPECIES: helix-turn-helix transcriptional regulator [Lactobacillus]RVU71460.1 XRE family transcriptional regulator [Lactobacillus xujianguonis]RVU73683.1 XRE family transcriptional regulator [Lactobacillus xujianguonis]